MDWFWCFINAYASPAHVDFHIGAWTVMINAKRDYVSPGSSGVKKIRAAHAKEKQQIREHVTPPESP